MFPTCGRPIRELWIQGQARRATPAELRALEVGERSARGRLGRRGSWKVRLPGAGSQGARACEPADPAPPLWLGTQPLPPQRGGSFPGPDPGRGQRSEPSTCHLWIRSKRAEHRGQAVGRLTGLGTRVWESAPPSPGSLGPTPLVSSPPTPDSPRPLNSGPPQSLASGAPLRNTSWLHGVGNQFHASFLFECSHTGPVFYLFGH